jgi:alkylation response protein AidB-like acyl-CoA dehydrogenase
VIFIALLFSSGGKDATRAFYEQHRLDVLKKYDHFKIGKVAGAKVSPQFPEVGALSAVPYAEQSGFQGFKSPYFKESHKKFQAAVRKFCETELLPRAQVSEENGVEPTAEVFQKMGKFGFLISRIGPGPWMKQWPLPLPGGVSGAEFDYFHEMIAHQELNRMGYPGYQDGLGAGFVIGLPVICNFGSPQLQQTVGKEVFLGNKRISLAISEAFAGSDVANLKTTAVKSADGKHYIVNGTKKWITNASFSDYFVTAVRTGKAGHDGISLLLIERGPGVNTEKIKTSYSGSAGTAFITFDDVKVPVENLLYKENKGFEAIMYNFNHERWLIIVGIISATRMVIEECMKWAHQRQVFGKPLIEQPVIRQKLGVCIAQVEAVQNWMENITYQMTQLPYAQQAKLLAGPIALLKFQATRVAHLVSDHAVQIFGGRGITRTGMGHKIEHFQKSIKFCMFLPFVFCINVCFVFTLVVVVFVYAAAILGGSEEIMADFGARQAMKYFPKNAKL